MSSVKFVLALSILAWATEAQANWREKIYNSELKNYKAFENCITKSSVQNGIPEILLMAVIRQEYGKPGQKKKNNPKSGKATYDYGIMQINDVRLTHVPDEVKPLIKNYGCLNIEIGARMLTKEIAKADDFWQGVGNYHYRYDGQYPHNHHTYVRKVRDKWMRMHNIATN
jgi:soluble lytic murein transglycosylase-like protein